MKKINGTLGVISILVFAVGVILKSMHLKGASLILFLLIGALGLLAFFIAYLLIGAKPLSAGLEKYSGIVGGLAMCLSMISFIFKTQHWPGASVLIVASQAALLATSIMLMIDSIKETDNVKQSIKTLFSFTLITIVVILIMLTDYGSWT